MGGREEKWLLCFVQFGIAGEERYEPGASMRVGFWESRDCWSASLLFSEGLQKPSVRNCLWPYSGTEMLFIKSPLLSPPCETDCWPQRYLSQGLDAAEISLLFGTICFLTSGWYLTTLRPSPLPTWITSYGRAQTPWRTAGYKELLRQYLSLPGFLKHGSMLHWQMSSDE